MRLIFSVLIFVSLFCAVRGKAQHTNQATLQGAIYRSIKKAYPASVRIWAFDTVRNIRTGPQFTGVVVTPEGHILTAAHVNTPRTTYKVMFPDGRATIAVGKGEIELEASPFMPDVAMLKIVNEGTWPFAPMGHSAKLAKGMLSISIAYPESLDQPLPMIRMGEIFDVHNEYGFIQSTCIMEPGDSGGPLFDEMGNVIGIHSAVDVGEKQNFEVPVDLYRSYWSALQQARTYDDFPLPKDTAVVESPATKLETYPQLSDLDNAVKLHPDLLKSAVLIHSTIAGKMQEIQGMLIDGMRLINASKSQGLSLVVSKASYVGDQARVMVNGKRFEAKVLYRDKIRDLVLLGITKKIRGGVDLKHVDTTLFGLEHIGTLLVSPLTSLSPRVSVLGTQLFDLAKLESIGYLGAQVAYFGPLVITEVSPSVNHFSPFQKGDELLAINGVRISSRAEYIRELKKFWPGDSLTVLLKRSGNDVEQNVGLQFRPEVAGVHQAERFKGGKSRRRDGFNGVFAHDASLKPEECGGPVIGIDGRLYGVNIGRFSRVSNLVVPALVVQQFVEEACSMLP
jgi:serine protease Do